MSDIGDIIKYCRIKRGVRLKDLSIMTGISASLLSQYETGLHSPTFRNLETVMHALGYNIIFSPKERRAEYRDDFMQNYTEGDE